ncbi:MAG: hypothetical protein IT225_05835 [Flavobacteriales bacterium]|jgi:curli biogenesis system outer membrane secretion channel CsgG|nr:hypothetical protein [Flavobacteriales bacterium]
MSRFTHILAFGAVALLLGACSGSKAFSKRGDKLDQAGLYAEAAEMYLQAAQRNAKNVDAKIGLKKTGQMLLNDKLSAFFKQMAMGDKRADAVAAYLDAKAYVDRVAYTGVVLEIPDHYRTDFEKVKAEHLVDLYTEGQALYEKEDFAAAEKVFAKITKLEPGYKDAKSLQDVAYLEPLYRTGRNELESGNYRKAYAALTRVMDKNSAYKDSNTLRQEALTKGQFNMAVMPFTTDRAQSALAGKVQAHAITALIEVKDPFLKVVDRENLDRILEEQRLSLSGVVDEQTAVRVGNLMGAQAVLMGDVVGFQEVPGQLRRSTKEGYEAYKVQQLNKETGEKYFVTRYKPVYYTEYYQENKVVLSLNYRVVSLETGEVLLSKVVEKLAEDHAYYASYDGNKDQLLPKLNGNVDLRDNARREMRSLLNAPREVKPVATLLNEVLRSSSSSMASAVRDEVTAKLP